jgi:hypothetical protein
LKQRPRGQWHFTHEISRTKKKLKQAMASVRAGFVVGCLFNFHQISSNFQVLYGFMLFLFSLMRHRVPAHS